MCLRLSVLLGSRVPSARALDIRCAQRLRIICNGLRLARNVLIGDGVSHNDDSIKHADQDQVSRKRRIPQTGLVIVQRAPRAADRGLDQCAVAGKADVEGCKDRLHEHCRELQSRGVLVAAKGQLFAPEFEAVPDGVCADALFRGESNLGFDFDPLRFYLCDVDRLTLEVNGRLFEEVFGRVESCKELELAS